MMIDLEEDLQTEKEEAPIEGVQRR